MKSEALTNVKEKLKGLIKSRNLTIYKIAEESDVTEACIHNWFSKRNYAPSIRSLESVCKVLNVSLYELFIDDNVKMYPLDTELQELARDYKSLKASQKEAVLAHIKSYRE